jgi:hypothetical protein
MSISNVQIVLYYNPKCMKPVNQLLKYVRAKKRIIMPALAAPSQKAYLKIGRCRRNCCNYRCFCTTPKRILEDSS